MDGFGSILVLLVIGFFHSIQAKFVWNTGGSSALFVAVALPLELQNKQVFLTYNFEAGYQLPKTWRQKPPFLVSLETIIGHIFYNWNKLCVQRNGNGTHNDGFLGDHHDHQQFDDFVYDDYYDDSHHSGHKHKPHHHNKKKKKPKPGAAANPPKNKHKKKHKHKPRPKPTPPPPEEEENDADYQDFFQGFPLDGMGEPLARSREKRTLLSRTKFYEILSHRFEMHGLGTGDRCLLRLICEANSYDLGDLNGVLGSLVHVIFSPSSSRYEALPKRYYIAELDGRKGKCAGYYQTCQHSVLDFITQPVLQMNKNKTTLH
ncbi:hypothetical protein KR018_011192 [Drosophila ironensis]|nr:hypothetical protein KR018_011192 [Drosophila ironensis]